MNIPDITFPKPMITPSDFALLGPSRNQLNPARWMHERVISSINDFEKELDQEHEVGARLVSFGSELTFHIEDVGFWGPDLIMFFGFNADNKPVQLLQHISQLSVLLVAMNKTEPEPRRIGFKLMEKLREKEDEDEE